MIILFLSPSLFYTFLYFYKRPGEISRVKMFKNREKHKKGTGFSIFEYALFTYTFPFLRMEICRNGISMKNENALMLISSTNARMMKNVNNQMNVSFKFQAKNAGLGSLSRKEPPVFGPWELFGLLYSKEMIIG